MIETGIVTIGGVKYATGLYWQPTASGSIARAAREAAKQPGQPVEFYAAREGVKGIRIAQFGLGAADMGHKINMPSIAASLANQQPGSWAGAFQVEQGFVVITVRDDLIDPEGDELFEDEAEAMSRLDEEITRGGLQKIYAPEGWAVPGADDAHISVLLSGRKDCRLKYIKPPVGIILGVLSALVIAGTIYSVFGLYQEHVDQLQRHKQQLRSSERALTDRKNETRDENASVVANLTSELAPKIKPEPKEVLSFSKSVWLEHLPKWQYAPEPSLWLKACRETFVDIPGVVLGWDLTQLKCEGSKLIVNYKRSTSEVAVYPENGAIDASGESLTVTYGLAGLSPRETTRGNDEPEKELMSERFITTAYLNNNWPVASISRDKLDDPPFDGRVKPDTPPPPAKWLKRKFTMSIPYSPWGLDKNFEKIPGVVLHQLTYRSGQWELKGVIYEVRD